MVLRKALEGKEFLGGSVDEDLKAEGILVEARREGVGREAGDWKRPMTRGIPTSIES